MMVISLKEIFYQGNFTSQRLQFYAKRNVVLSRSFVKFNDILFLKL